MVEKEKVFQRWVPTSEPAHRFARFLEICGVEKAEFERELGYGPQRVGQWFTQKKPAIPGGDVMREIHQFAGKRGVIGVSYDWFNFGIGDEPRRIANDEDASIAKVIAMDIASPAFDPKRFIRLEYLEGFSREPTRFVDIPLFLLREHATWRSETVRGFVNPSDNMRGEIEKADLVFVETADNKVDVDGIYAYKLGGIPQIRHIQVRGKGILRLTGTKSYEDSIELSGSELDDLEIGGRVVGCIGSKAF